MITPNSHIFFKFTKLWFVSNSDLRLIMVSTVLKNGRPSKNYARLLLLNFGDVAGFGAFRRDLTVFFSLLSLVNMEHPIRIELINNGMLTYLSRHYTTLER